MKWVEKSRERMHKQANSIGNFLVEGFHYLGLFAIGGVTACASIMAFLGMIEKGSVSVDDILLLFIYLELGAMVGIYFKTNHLPIRFLLYVAITALTRYLIGDVSHHKEPDVGLLYVCGGIFFLALSVLAVRFASYKFPSSKVIDATGEAIGDNIEK
ncbi:MAG: phosphate-starvation-inducible PsiE family protein [Candidatus Oceanisphaera merdipullorum]|nr:phosphate-starvation-inducible PsiE family protein [Candidatus Oceanisphaera merdipullorum]